MKIIQPNSESQWQQYYQLRWQVLRAPWHQAMGSERDALEAESEHVMAISETGEVLGVGRVHFNKDHQAQIRYMAVDEHVRGQGIGTRLLAELESIARRRGVSTIVLDARETALEFYARHGYDITGEGHTLFGEIRHRKMRKQL